MPSRWDADARNIGMNRNLTDLEDRVNNLSRTVSQLTADVDELRQKIERLESARDADSQLKQG